MAKASKSETFTLQLTREEALGLVLLKRSAVGLSSVREAVDRVGEALQDIDPSLGAEQLDERVRLGEPTFDLGVES